MIVVSKRYDRVLRLLIAVFAMRAGVSHGDTVIVDALGNRTCYPMCPSVTRPVARPLVEVRHGLEMYSDGAFGNTERIVDFDARTLSIVKFRWRQNDGQAHTEIISRRDIAIPDDDLSQLHAVVDSIWAANSPIPAARIGLGGEWHVTLFNNGATRTERVMGMPGGAALDLGRLLDKLETTQGVSMVSLDRHWYFLFACYSFASRVHTEVPLSFAYSRERWTKRLREPDEFPPAPVHFEQFQMESDQESCGQLE